MAESILGDLKTKRQEIIDSTYLDVRVSTWESPDIFVRYTPLSYAIIRNAMKAIKQGGKNQSIQELNAQMDLLIKACAGIYVVIDDKKGSLNPDGLNSEWTKFDEDLARALETELTTARDVLKELFIFDGEIVSHVEQLIEFSKYSDKKTDDEFYLE